MGIIAGLLRITLIFLAVRFVWKAVARALGLEGERRRVRNSPSNVSEQTYEKISDAEDIEFEDIE